MNVQCLRCKGRGFCGREFCAIHAKARAGIRVSKMIAKDEFSSMSPAPFVGRVGYPHVNVGILAPPERVEDATEYDSPRLWADKNYAIPKIIDFRSSLINSRFAQDVKISGKDDAFLGLSQEIGMASKPVDLEIKLEKKPSMKLKFDATTAPTGPSAKLKNVQLTSNPKIHSAVEKVFDDIDLKATSAISYLQKKGFDENFLSKMLSIGTMGIKSQRKLVPTRWAITATDDTLANSMLANIKSFPEHDYAVHFGGYLGNYFLIAFFPEAYNYELFEMYMPNAEWNTTSEMQYTTDYEPYFGRKSYAENCTGGFYAAKLGVCEELSRIKRQATCLVIRVITGEYAVPLGVWVVREATRKALKEKPIKFSSKELMMKYVVALTRKKFGFEIDPVLKKSVILNDLKNQSRLNQFF